MSRPPTLQRPPESRVAASEKRLEILVFSVRPPRPPPVSARAGHDRKQRKSQSCHNKLEVPQHLAPRARAQAPPSRELNAVADEPHRAIGQKDIHPAGVIAPGGV